jgi:integrase
MPSSPELAGVAEDHLAVLMLKAFIQPEAVPGLGQDRGERDGRDRALDGGRKEVQPLRPSGRDYDLDWLSPRLAGVRVVRSAMVQREQGVSSQVFMTERDGPMTPKAFHALFGRIGARAKMPFPIHPHMMRHGCGYALANAGHDTRALQAWLGHKNIQHTVRYTELAPDRFKNFWR